MVQVLPSSLEVVLGAWRSLHYFNSCLDDLEILRSIQWKAIVIDEYRHSEIANELEQIKMLSTEMRIILVSDHIKDISEHLKIVSLVDLRILLLYS
ncbi:hypothetical protein C2S51_037951 [Perilla frutescens var. frutescens]|nr:hypothetical protein C2S51_037951 [Perilla frutescens var. frutescens]